MLSRPDQRQLLIRNTPIYVQLHIGSFFVDKVDNSFSHFKLKLWPICVVISVPSILE